MKTVLKISIIFVIVSVAWCRRHCHPHRHCRHHHRSGRNPFSSIWNNWKTTYHYNYPPSEERQRHDNFMIVHNKLNNHNQLYLKQQHNYSVGHNEHSAMSDDEFRENMMGLLSEQNCDNSSATYKPPEHPDIPESIDYRDYGYVTPVQNQGPCGACWAFVAVASLEGQYKRITGQLVKLSEQNLLDCSYPQGNMGCKGGIMCRAYEYAATIPGVDTEKAYPYTGNNSDGKCHYNPKAACAPVGGYLEIKSGDEQTLKTAVGLIGPVAAGFDGSPANFRYYKGGIFSDPTCSSTALTHALTIIGYGTENGTDYWLVKNSWGTSWGDGGFGKILRNTNECGIASRASFPVLRRNKDGSPELDGPAASP